MKPTKKSYDDSCSWPNEIKKTPALRKSKYYYINTGSFWHHNNCGSTHPSMATLKENKLPPSLSGFKSQKFLHESSYGGFSGTDNTSNPFTLENYPLWGYFATNIFITNELKAEWHFKNLLELHYPARRGYIFADWAGVRKVSYDTAHRVAFAITRFITFQRLTFYDLLAYRD